MITKNLDKGLWKEILIFTIPVFLSYLFQNLYNSVDSIVVGNLVSKEALAAVSNCSTVTNIMVGFFAGLSSGAMTIFARYYGAKKYDMLDRSIHTAISFSIIFGALMAIIGYYSSDFLLRIMNFPEEVIYYASPYIKVYFTGSIFSALFNICSSISRAIGDSKTPFNILLLTTFSNIVLDLLFVSAFNLSVIGVSLSTVISQAISSILILWMLSKRKEYFDIKLKKLRIDRYYLNEIISKGLPAGIQTCMISLSNSLLQRYVNSFDTNTITGIGAAGKVDNFVAMPCQSFGIAVASFVAKYNGSQDKEKIRQSIIVSTVLMLISTTILCVPITLFSDTFVKIFNSDPGVVEAGTAMVKVIAPLYFINGLMQISFGVNRGFGKAFQVMIFSMLAMIVVRQAFLFIAFSIVKKIFFIHICYPLCWAFALLFNVIFFFTSVKPEYDMIGR